MPVPLTIAIVRVLASGGALTLAATHVTTKTSAARAMGMSSATTSRQISYSLPRRSRRSVGALNRCSTRLSQGFATDRG